MTTVMLSGCISLDFFLPQQAPPDGPEGLNGLVRIWVATQPGAIGNEFVHYNLTFGPSGHIQDPFQEITVPMNSTLRTVDLVALEKHSRAVAIAGLVTKPGDYYGFTFQVTNASLATDEVVGNVGGKEVVRVKERPISNNTKVSTVRVAHAVIANSITDLYLEIDLRKSLTEEDGAYHHATSVVGASVYINGNKAGEFRSGNAKKDGSGGAFDPYGTRWADNSRFSPPRAIYLVDDVLANERIYDSRKTNRHYTAVVGLGQDLRFSSESYSMVMERGEEGIDSVPLVEHVWNFADGTSAAGWRATHNWTAGGIYDVSLTVRDELDLVGRTHGTFLVPYRPDEAVLTQQDARAGTITLGSATVPVATNLHTASESLVFPDDLEDGDLRLGAYRVTVRFTDPTGGATGAGTTMAMHVRSGWLDARVSGTSPLVMETAGIPTWRIPTVQWVDGPIDVDLELLTGAEVSYEVVVEALYYENATRGFDGHPGHRHGPWPFGPDLRTVHWNGTAVRDEDA